LQFCNIFCRHRNTAPGINKNMFNNSKYTKWYFQIIANAKLRKDLIKFERHHIIPKSLGGNNKNDNLVRLTPREHFVCHRLLTKMAIEPGNRRSLHYAFWRMISQTTHPNQDRDYIITSKIFEISRLNLKGKPHSEERKQNISKAKKGKPIWSEEQKIEMSKYRKGVPKSESHKSKIAASSLIRPPQLRKTCEHCGINVILGNYTRWHGDNCKLFKIVSDPR